MEFDVLLKELEAQLMRSRAMWLKLVTSAVTTASERPDSKLKNLSKAEKTEFIRRVMLKLEEVGLLEHAQENIPVQEVKREFPQPKKAAKSEPKKKTKAHR